MDIKLRVDKTTPNQNLEQKIRKALNKALRLEKEYNYTSDETSCHATITFGNDINIRTLSKVLEQYKHTSKQECGWQLVKIYNKSPVMLVFDYYYNPLVAARI
ncbi:MAG: hypothetical protein PHO02_00330 [Candidatus Nanoarchaeia archaeon]|nr:hypothetical protein [Candidatus Nanoarchaeia archaeon]